MKKILIPFFFLYTHFLYTQNLVPYEMYSNHFNIEMYTKEANRAFDEEGVITQGGQYHALTISVYGTMCIEKFRKSNDSTYLTEGLNQYKYFSDSSRLIFIENNTAVGLPYRKMYHGLKPPWFSGLTQGMAASYLFRYYELTKDEKALSLAQKIIKFMIRDEKDSGTMSKTIEGYTWIEEYPNYKGSKGVLNGFVNGLIGLKEYLTFFPEDTIATRIHNECYTSLFATLEAYDKPNWTSYNRNGSSIRNSYIRLQIQQFDHLFSIYKDERFRLQMRLWSLFAFNKIDKEWKFHNDATYNFGVILDEKDGRYFFSDSAKFSNSLKDVDLTLEGSINKQKIKKINFQIEKGHYYIQLPPFIQAENVKNLMINGLKSNHLISSWSKDLIIIESEKELNEIKIKLKKKVRSKNVKKEIKLYEYDKFKVPMFGLVKLNNVIKKNSGGYLEFNIKGKYIINPRVFYRIANSAKDLDKKKFSIIRSFDPISERFRIEEDGFYDFFISYDIVTPNSEITSIEIVEN